MRARYDMRWAIGPLPFAVSRPARSAAGCGSQNPGRIDVVLLTAMTDSWLPVTFLRLAEPLQVPTIDLTGTSGRRRR